jgi:hypothetical protein
MKHSMTRAMNAEDQLVSRMTLSFLLMPLVLLALAGAVIAV